MKYVLDSSVAFKWLALEAGSDEAQRLRDGYRNAVHDLLAPDVFPVEVTHALTRAQRQGRVSRALGSALFASLATDLPRLFPSLALLRRAYEISSDARIGIYDCLYAALAGREACELVTADDRLKRTLPDFPIRLLGELP